MIKLKNKKLVTNIFKLFDSYIEIKNYIKNIFYIIIND